MTILIVLTTILLILDCLLLCLLVLVQLPKKDAGIGMAFGGGAADALFGAGSGTALSSLTKYTSIGFFALVFLLSVLNNHAQHANVSDLRQQFEKQSAMPTTTAPAPAAKPTVTSTTSTAIPLTITSNGAAATPAPMTPAPVKK